MMAVDNSDNLYDIFAKLKSSKKLPEEVMLQMGNFLSLDPKLLFPIQRQINKPLNQPILTLYGIK